MGVLTVDPASLDRILSELTNLYGPVAEMSEPVPFTYTDYYDREMGAKPYRLYLSFSDLVDPSRLSEIKNQTNGLEERLRADSGNRSVNLDPGLLTSSSLILATCKNRSHRVPLANGIYAELTLMYQGKEFRTFPWTYADYASEPVKRLFSAWRLTYLEQLKRQGPTLT